MPLLNYLPIITAVFFVVGIVLLFKNADKIKFRNLILLFFMIGAGLAFSILETLLIYKNFGYDDLIIKEKLVIFIIGIIANSANCLLKGILINNEIKKGNSYLFAVPKMSGIDILNLAVLIVFFLVFK